MIKTSIIAFAEASRRKVIAAVGDSITRGYMSSDESQHSWPAQLQSMLNPHTYFGMPFRTQYEVRNFGVNGRAVQKHSILSYWREDRYQEALESNPDIVIIMLGTNDSWEGWNEEKYVKDYGEFIETFQALASKPDIYLMVPPPLYRDGKGQWKILFNQHVIN